MRMRTWSTWNWWRILTIAIITIVALVVAASCSATIWQVFESGLDQPIAIPTNTPLAPLAEDVGEELGVPTDVPTEETPSEVGIAYLRVETQLYAGRDLWAPLPPTIWIFLSPYQTGDREPDPTRVGTMRQVLGFKYTKDSIYVGLTTFEAPLGMWVVSVDQSTLSEKCFVWVPLLEEDPTEVNPVTWSPPLTLDIRDRMYTWKFQIVCGEEFIPTPTNPPGGPVVTPVVPTNTPRPTNPPPTEPPPPTPEPTKVGCNCPTPVEPLPELPPPTEWDPTPTSTPIHQ